MAENGGKGVIGNTVKFSDYILGRHCLFQNKVLEQLIEDVRELTG